MTNIDLYNVEGKVTGKVDLPKTYFEAKVNLPLVAQAVQVYLGNQRKAHAKAQTRADVDLTKAKWFRQKGTGRARHGSKSAPIFVGGGAAHGPTGEQNFQRKLSAQMKKQALASALTSKLQDKELVVLEGLSKASGKTKEMREILKPYLGKKVKVLLVITKEMTNALRASRNIAGVNVQQADLLHTYEVINADKVVFATEAIELIKQK